MNSTNSIELLPPAAEEDWNEARRILREYGDSLGVDLRFQCFDEEVAQLPEAYGGRGEVFLLGWVDGEPAACGAVRALNGVDEPAACEMKRLYVRPAFRGFGLGRLMAQTLMERALEAGFSVMYLDTLSDMAAARELYAGLGFELVEPYYYNPLPGAHHFRAELSPGSSRY